MSVIKQEKHFIICQSKNCNGAVVAHCHGNRLEIRGSWARILAFQSTFDPGLPENTKKSITFTIKRLHVIYSLDTT